MPPSPSGSGPPGQFDLDNLDLDNFDFANFDALEATIHRQDTEADVAPPDVQAPQDVEASENFTAPVHEESTIDLDGNTNVTTAQLMNLFPEWRNDADIDVNEAPTPQAPPQQEDTSIENQDDEAKLQTLREQNRILNERAAARYAEERRQKAEKERAELKERKQKMEAEQKAKQDALRARIARARELEERARKAKELEEEQERRTSAEAFRTLQGTRAGSPQTPPQPRSILKSPQTDRNSPGTKRRRNSPDDSRVRFETGKSLKKVRVFDKDKPVTPPKTVRPQNDTETMEVDPTAQSYELPHNDYEVMESTEFPQMTAPTMAPERPQSTAPAIVTQPPQLTAPTTMSQSRQGAHTSVAVPARNHRGNVVDPINRPQLDALGAAIPGGPNPLILEYVPTFARSVGFAAGGAIRSVFGRDFMYTPQMTSGSNPPSVGYSPYAARPGFTPSFVGNSPYATNQGTATHDSAQLGHPDTAPQSSSGSTGSNHVPQQLQWQNFTPTDHIAAPLRIPPHRQSASSSAPRNQRLSDNVSAASRAAYLPIAQAVRGGFPGAPPPFQRIPPPPLQFEIDKTIPTCEKCCSLHKRCNHKKKSAVPRTRQPSDQVCDDCRFNKRRCTHNGATPTQTNPPSTNFPPTQTNLLSADVPSTHPYPLSAGVLAKEKRRASQKFTRKHPGFKCDNCRRLKQTCTHDDPSLLSHQMSDGDLMQSVTDFRAQIRAIRETHTGLGISQDNDALNRRRRDLEGRIAALEEIVNRMLAELAQRGFVMASMQN